MTLAAPRLTHVAIGSNDIERSIDFYTSMTPLVVVHRHDDEMGEVVWLSNEGQVVDPFVVVLAQFYEDEGDAPPTLGPFTHLGIEVPERADIDAIAEKARAAGCLYWEPRQMWEPIGYICAVKDPDGNVIEFSHDQRVFSTVRELWGEPDDGS